MYKWKTKQILFWHFARSKDFFFNVHFQYQKSLPGKEHSYTTGFNNPQSQLPPNLVPVLVEKCIYFKITYCFYKLMIFSLQTIALIVCQFHFSNSSPQAELHYIKKVSALPPSGLRKSNAFWSWPRSPKRLVTPGLWWHTKAN